MDNNTPYETQAIDLNLLSVLDITKEGKVVSVEKWVELWNLVFQHINKIDAFCVDMQSTLNNWHEAEIVLNEIIEDMQIKYNALSTEFIHYGENPPENPHIMLWVRHRNDITPNYLLTNEDVDSELSSTSENPVQNKVANAALNNKMDKNNPTGTGSFSLNRRSDTVVGDYSFAEGNNTEASGEASHAEGMYTNALGGASHAEGNTTVASGGSSHAEGFNTTASGNYSHAEGFNTTASGDHSHAEGRNTTALGIRSHAEGFNTEVSGSNSHTEGSNTKASSDYQHVQGKYNIPDSNNIYADIIGNGSSDTERSNAYTLDWNGNAWYAGDVYVGSTSGTNKDAGSKKLATEKVVLEAVSAEQKRADNTFSNALRGSASGETINLTDVSPNEHTLNVKIHSKNLWQHTSEAAYLNRASYESDTRLYTVNTDGVIWYVHTFQNPIPKNTAVSVTVEVISGNGTVSIGGYHKESGKNTWQGNVEIPKNTDLSGKTYTASFTTNDTVTDLCIFADANSTIAEPIIFRVQYELGETATSYTPYVPDLTAVKVSRYGKNLFDINGFINLTGNSTYYGINDNGELYVKQSDYRDDTVIPVFITLEAGTYTLSSTTAITSSFKLINLTDNKVIAFNNNITFSIEKVTSLGIKCYQSADTVIGKLQLELGSTATDYEPYKECEEYTPAVDGTVNGATSLYPNTTLMTDTKSVIIDCEYNRDINKAFAALEAAIATNNS